MRTSTVLVTLAAAAASAAPVAQKSEDYTFQVSEWNAGCGRSGCTANFKVAGAATTDYPKHPAFEASCFVSGEGADYTPCQLTPGSGSSVSRSVKAKLLEATRVEGENTIAHIQVSYVHADEDQAGAYFNATGTGDARYNAAVLPPMSFTITPQWFGVA